MADKGSKKKTGLTLACIILAVLIIFIVFLVKKDTILTNLKETRFFDRVFGSTPEFVENHTPSEKETVKIPLAPESEEVVIKVEPQTPSKPASEPEKTQAPQAQSEKKEETPAETKKSAQETKPVQNAYTELQTAMNITVISVAHLVLKSVCTSPTCKWKMVIFMFFGMTLTDMSKTNLCLTHKVIWTLSRQTTG